MTWYSFVFPNTALTTATFAVDMALNGNRGIQVFGCVLAVGTILTWFFVFGMMIRAVLTKQILWPQRQEDRNEGGWVEGDERMRSIDRAREVSIRRATLNQIKLLDEAQAARQSSMFKNDEEVQEFDRSDFAIKEREKAQLPTRGRKLQQQKQDDKKQVSRSSGFSLKDTKSV